MPPACPACGCVRLRPHCDGRDKRNLNPACTWWVCRKCTSYGDNRKFHDAQKKDPS
jgi:hypothetical protein